MSFIYKPIYKLILMISILYGLIMVQSTPISAEVPLKVTVQTRLSTDEGMLSGPYNVKICIQSDSDTTDSFSVPTPCKWTYEFKDDQKIIFINGYGSMVLGTDTDPNKQLSANNFNVKNPHFKLKVYSDMNDIPAISFPIPSTPYAIHAQVAETVERIHAESITGTFNTLAVSGNTNLGKTLYVSSLQNNVGINTDTPSSTYRLDVSGSIHASGYTVNGESIESKFAWKRNNEKLYYASGNVGIGTSEPNHALDISGNINASHYLINGEDLISKLNASASWLNGQGNSIYYVNHRGQEGSGKVGIGVSINLIESLEVSGAIRIGKSSQKRRGTIEYDSDKKDFIGYINDNVPHSLSGVQIEGEVNTGQLLKWHDTRHVTGISKDQLIITNNSLGIGTANPTAIVTVQGTRNVGLMNIQTETYQPALMISKDGNVGILTEPDARYALNVNGTLNATNILIGGNSFEANIGTDPFWTGPGTDGRIYYSYGNVGIGTHSPRNLLEISNLTAEGNAAITFDLEGKDLFTMGVDSSKQDLFTISKGSDLNDSIFSFSKEKTGIGTNDPKATLHVHGGAGFLITGPTNNAVGSLQESGPGTKLFFYPKKAAFRAGHVDSNQWDSSNENNNIGQYSVAFGHNTTALGEGSAIVGGYNNTASGRYSAVLGGANNTAGGAYSVAAGTDAFVHSSHSGTFVWNSRMSNDKTPRFESEVNNQFIINAPGGVGIGTNQTDDAVLTIQPEPSGPVPQYTAVFKNASGVDVAYIRKDGSLSIGTTPHSDTQLAVQGKVGIGTNQSNAQLTIVHQGSNGYIMKVITQNGTASTFVITGTGNIGIGTDSPTQKLQVNGSIKANNFIIVDQLGNQTIIQPSQGSPWSIDSRANNIYRHDGFVGIGTPSPNSLLELSNRGGKAPEITFDIDHTDYYAMGVVTRNKVFMFQQGSSLNVATIAALIVTQNRVGIGMSGNSTPSTDLHVSGNVIISKGLAIGIPTTNGYALNVNGTVRINDLYIRGVSLNPKPTPWVIGNHNGEDILYYTSGNVGIGTSLPNATLEVLGNAIVSNLTVSNDVNLSTVNTKVITFVSGNSNTELGTLGINADSELIYTPYSGIGMKLTAPLDIQKNIKGNISGPIAIWTSSTNISQLPLFWNNGLSLTGNMLISSYRASTGTEIYVSSNIMMGAAAKNAMYIDLELGDTGAGSNFTDYSAQKIDVKIKNNWGNTEDDALPNKVTGVEIGMSTEPGVSLINNAQAIGLQVDVSSGNTNVANAYAAIFMGGNVGVGVRNPQAKLEVNGMISANAISISDELIVDEKLIISPSHNTLYVNNNILGQARVGIGTNDPQSELDIHGMISANQLTISGGLEITTVNIGNGSFIINPSGNVGIGTIDPQSYIEIATSINSTAITDPFIAEKIGIYIDDDLTEGQSFTLDRDLTALKIKLNSNNNNMIAGNKSAIGLDVNMSGISTNSTGTVIGLNVDVSKPSDQDPGTRYAALFQGGYVGIGTRNPTAKLEVSGDIKANKLILQNLEASHGTYNRLVVNQIASMNSVTVNTLRVMGSVFATRIAVNSNIDVPLAKITTLNATEATIGQLTAQDVSINGGITVNSMVSLSRITSSGDFTINVSSSNTFSIKGTVSANTTTIRNGLFFDKSSSPYPTYSNGGVLYVDNSGDLKYATQNTNEAINITSAFRGTPGKIAVVSSRELSDQGNLYWDETNSIFQVGASNIGTTFKIKSDVASNQGTLNAEVIELNIPNRTLIAETTTIRGTHIILKSGDEGASYTSLAAGDTAVGLNVDVSGLGVNPGAKKYAAIFKGGRVGIGASEPNAALHVKKIGGSENNQIPLFQVDLDSKEALVVSANGNVSIGGTPEPNTQLTVHSSDQDTYALYVWANSNPAFVIKENGNVGIGKVPESGYKLDVNGSIRTRSLELDNTTSALKAGRIEVNSLEIKGSVDFANTGGITATSITSDTVSTNTLSVSGTTTFSGDVNVTGTLAANSIQLAATTSTSDDASRGTLYVNDNKLYYKQPGSGTGIDLVSHKIGDPNKIAYYNRNGELSAAQNISFDESINEFKVEGEDDTVTTLKINANVGSLTTSLNAELIELIIPNRQVSPRASIIGTQITLKGNGTSGESHGKLANEDTAVGLKVDLSNLPVESGGKKYAGLFLGGRVGLGILEPDAALHVNRIAGSENDQTPLFQVDLDSTEVFVVSSNGNIAIGGKPEESTKLTVHSSDEDTYALYVSTNATPAFVIKENGNVGIGTVPESGYKLDVNGQMDVKIGDDSKLKVTEGGVGIGGATAEDSFVLNVRGNVKLGSLSRDDKRPLQVIGNNIGINLADNTSPAHPLHVGGVLYSGLSETNCSLLATDDLGFCTDKIAIGVKSGMPVIDFNEKTIVGGSTSPLVFDNGNVGIGGDPDLTAKLKVSGRLKVGSGTVGSGTVGSGFNVGTDGHVGIKVLSDPSHALNVNGSAKFTNLTVTDNTQTVTVNNIVINNKLIVNKEVLAGNAAISETIGVASINLTVSANLSNKSVYGLRVKLESEDCQTDTKCFVQNGNVTGLLVDVGDLNVGTSTQGSQSFQNRNAAIFMGGNVGIGTDTPGETLTVMSTEGNSIAGFSAGSVSLVVESTVGKAIGFDLKSTGSQFDGLYFRDIGGETNVAIGTEETGEQDIFARLVVNGDIRVGVIKPSSPSNQINGCNNRTRDPIKCYGDKLYFSGGPSSETTDGENGDSIWMARYNYSTVHSELRVNISSSNMGEDRFAIGYNNGDGSFVTGFAVSSTGNVGIFPDANTIREEIAAPLHVKGKNMNIDADITRKENHLVVIENEEVDNAHSLAIVHSTRSPITSEHNFVTFVGGTSLLGEIEGNSAGNGVRFKTRGADYAEYLEKIEPNEDIEKGDIVGVFHGKISKSTSGAQQMLVRSSAAAVAGNWPGPDKSGYELIAFFGQVNIKVIGKVNIGDYIIPSGHNDGSGIAIPEDDLTLEQKQTIVGRAWESSIHQKEKLVLCAVGLNFTQTGMNQEMEAVELLRKEVYQLEKENQVLAVQLDRIEEKDQEIEALIKKLKK